MIEEKTILFHSIMIREKIDFFVFKGLENLDLRIKYGGKDIDIYVDNKNIRKARDILIDLEFEQSFYNKNQFIIFEKDSNRFLMFDLISYIPLGDKSFYDFKLIPQLEKSSINYRKFNRLNNSEYIVLSFIRNILNTKSFNKELDFLKEIVVKEKIKSNYFSLLFNVDTTILQNEILEIKNWEELRFKYYSQFKRKVIKSNSYYYRSFFIILKKITIYLKKLLLKRKGSFIVIQGVDGAGKSTIIKHIEQQEYLKYKGVKSIYFGHNNYWIPFLKKMIKRKNKTKLFNRFLFLLSFIDRRLRVLKAIFFKFFGYIIIGDRYYYDDLIGNNQKSFIFLIFKKVFFYDKIYEPDLLIYLKVSPKASYLRKQDYSYDLLKKTIKNYDSFFSKLERKKFFVEIIDADKSLEEVKKNVLQKTYELLLSK